MHGKSGIRQHGKIVSQLTLLTRASMACETISVQYLMAGRVVRFVVGNRPGQSYLVSIGQQKPNVQDNHHVHVFHAWHGTNLQGI